MNKVNVTHAQLLYDTYGIKTDMLYAVQTIESPPMICQILNYTGTSYDIRSFKAIKKDDTVVIDTNYYVIPRSEISSIAPTESLKSFLDRTSNLPVPAKKVEAKK